MNNNKTLELRNLLCKSNLRVDRISNQFTKDGLVLMLSACKQLGVILSCEMELISSVSVRAMILDDMNKLNENVAIIKGAINLNELELESFCLN